MKASPAAASALLAAMMLAIGATAEECVTGGFLLEFNGQCTPEAIIAAYESQVFHAPGGISPSCAIDAETDLLSKLSASGSTLQSLCDTVYANQEVVPFSNAAKRSTDMQFEQMFFNGRTDWQEEVETLYDDYGRVASTTATAILADDAEAVRVFFESVAQGRRVSWPGEQLPNFANTMGVTDTAGAPTCVTNAAMCCWPKDRQANDGNGNCAKPYDTNCVDKDVADNTDLCYVSNDRGTESTGYNSELGFTAFPNDNADGEGAIHCHGFAWSNDAQDGSARYKANNLFFVSMYDHMHNRGYVENVPGAPMCACVEQMPTVTRSDCTQINLTETITIEYDSSTGLFVPKLTAVKVAFAACQGINNRNNDLWAYMARLYYQGDITPQQFGVAGRIITNESTCGTSTTKYQLNKIALTTGYDHDVSTWTNVAGREALKLRETYGHRAFVKSLTPDATAGHYGIIYRACASCTKTHMKIYYRRLTPIPETFNLLSNILYDRNNGAGQNVWNTDFSLHSTYADAIAGANAWKCPGGVYNYDQTFYGECSPSGTRVSGQRSLFHPGWDSEKVDVAYYVNKAEDAATSLLIEPTTTIGPGQWANYGAGIAFENPTDRTMYMSGAGSDIWGNADDFSYWSETKSDDHQNIIVRVSGLSSMYNTAPSAWSKTGIMIRSTLEPGSPHYSLFLTGTQGVCTQGRMTLNGGPSHWNCVNIGAKAAWIKIEKRVNTFSSFAGVETVVGGDPSTITWTPIQWTTQIIPAFAAGQSYRVGLAVSSNSYYPIEATFTNYVSQMATLSPTLSPTSFPTRLPTNVPTSTPTRLPTSKPTPAPSRLPTSKPTLAPTTSKPTTSKPTTKPTTAKPTAKPTTAKPTAKPTTAKPTAKPTTAKPV